MAKRIEQRIIIEAPASRVWELLADIPRWSEWNPLYACAHGELRLGAELDLAVVLPGLKPQSVKATVTDATRDRRLGYLTVNRGGLARGDRYVEIEDRGDGGCIVANGEIMSGPLGALLAAVAGKKVEQALAGMNFALKTRAEAKPD